MSINKTNLSARVALAAVFLLVLALVLQSCSKFEYSPYEVRLKEDEKHINQRNVARIEALDIGSADTLRFILTSDTQGFYQSNEDIVHHINGRRDVDFVLISGDLTDFGLQKEFVLVHDSFKKLKVPYIAVIGNHDAIDNGKQVYRAMYGDFDFSFAVGGRKFILLNTNNLEFKKQAPDLEWLQKELAQSTGYDHTFVVSHISPTSFGFGKEKAQRYGDLLSQHKVSYSLHGHDHNFKHYFPFDESVPYLHTGTTDQREYIVFTVVADTVTFERVKF
ncbi:metallophosphoesterase [Pontibacter diazotrophicus]|uniref:Metallophosphoesterase n=1 Tax=Pontibacter diazotrophicus TaxID=1400979 RepID=A0A3D8LFH5_9BACT|nr:metallophosphoesterase [Pontibacter diazotrophicus]RDV16199.1 metallophosphoesterase [Pontibacter diazotrophicus]